MPRYSATLIVLRIIAAESTKEAFCILIHMHHPFFKDLYYNYFRCYNIKNKIYQE
jgi:hypothetical protein